MALLTSLFGVWKLSGLTSGDFETANWAEVLERIARPLRYSSGELSWLTSLRLSSGLLLSVTAGSSSWRSVCSGTTREL